MDDPQFGNARKYARRGHRTVGGWLTATAAETIVTLATVQGRLGIVGGACEIGVYHGKLFILLYHLLQPTERALAIDLFANDEYGRDLRAQFQRNLARHGADLGRVSLIAENSMRLSSQQVRATVGPVRLFSVDGGHSAEETANDLSIGAGSLTEGGLLILDDFFNSEWPAVAEGTCRFMAGNRQLSPVAIVGNRFIFASGSADAYRTALAGPTTAVFGQPVVTVPSPTLRQSLKETSLWKAIRHRPLGGWARRGLHWLN